MNKPPIETILLILGATAVLFWPQFSAMVKGAVAKFRSSRKDRRESRADELAGPKTRSEWVTDLMELHDLLAAAGEDELAGLCCQLCNGLICIAPPADEPAPTKPEKKQKGE